MKLEIEMHCCSSEMINAFANYLKQYDITLGGVVEKFIFAMDRSDRIYERSQDIAGFAEGFFDRVVSKSYGISFRDRQSFIFHGEPFNEEFMKYVRGIPKCKNKPVSKNCSSKATSTDFKSSKHGENK